jgi:ATP-dependent Clp protease ATP-binding subunit ClpA
VEDNRVASDEYLREVQAAYPAACSRLTERSKDVLRAAHDAARELDTDHVGTEHIAVGLFDRAPAVNDALRSVGITRRVFLAALEREEGRYPEHGVTPVTPRALAVVVEAARAAGDHEVEPEHIAVGLLDESTLWKTEGYGGPHHLEAAAALAGSHVHEVREALESLIGMPPPPAD